MVDITGTPPSGMLSTININGTRLPLVRLFLLALSVATSAVTAENAPPPVALQTLEQLEQRLAEIHIARHELARLTHRQGVGNLGWLSISKPDAQQQQWAKIQLREETQIDAIALVPILWHDALHGILPDGFPAKFQIVAGTHKDTTGTVVASFDSKEKATSRITPYMFAIEPIQASWIRVDISEATQIASDGQYGIQLAELLAFNGQDIVSIDAAVEAASSRKTRVSKAHTKKSLVDGFIPYVMDAMGTNSQSYVAFYNTHSGPFDFTIDLGEAQPINRLQLHAADLSENVPKIQHADYALPKKLVVQGANHADFSDSVDLCTYDRGNIYDAGPIIIKQFPETSCQYIRLRVDAGYVTSETEIDVSGVGFAEIELFADQENVALGLPFKVSPNIAGHDGILSALTDNKNHFGSIMPYRDWIQELANRGGLESERLAIGVELKSRYAKQKQHLRTLSWATGLLAIGTVFAILINRNRAMRREARLKERFAADLHDEIGADLHTIGLLSDLAQEARTDPAKLSQLLQQIRDNTEESGHTVRNMVQLQSGISQEGFEGMMRRTAERTVTHLEHEIFIEGAHYLNGLKSSSHSDLLRFYKECLINVCRRSEATRLRTRLTASHNRVDLTVSDNGRGISKSAKDWIPKSLKRRAKLLGAKVQLEESGLGGTKIHLTIRHSFFPFTLNK